MLSKFRSSIFILSLFAQVVSAQHIITCKAYTQAGEPIDIIYSKNIKKQVLVGPWDDFQWNRGYLFDVIINLFGFVPLGLFLSLFLSSVVAIHSRKKNLLFTISICFVISLGIELAQVYIPTRDSQLSDLICNTLGGTIGGFLGTWKRK